MKDKKESRRGFRPTERVGFRDSCLRRPRTESISHCCGEGRWEAGEGVDRRGWAHRQWRLSGEASMTAQAWEGLEEGKISQGLRD